MNGGFPALYTSADDASNRSQAQFLWSIRAEYGLLFLAAIISAFSLTGPLRSASLVVVLICLGATTIVKYQARLDKAWYEARALAESIKTLTWRFGMKAHPYNVGDAQSEASFRATLSELLKLNKGLGETLHYDNVDAAQITEWMRETRKLAASERLHLYMTSRVRDQKGWYSKKSKQNRSAQKKWIILAVALYILAALSLFPEVLPVSAFERSFDPILVVVTAIIGWLQVKRHGELSASYGLTAQEIGILETKTPLITDDESFSEFVNEAELAFSREHTQWLARQDVI